MESISCGTSANISHDRWAEVTLTEEFAKLTDSIYFKANDALYVNLLSHRRSTGGNADCA
jgi:hypothetical protein